MGIQWLKSLGRRFSKSQQSQPTGPVPRQPMLEPLEGRQMLSAAAVVTSTLADNRGHVEIRFNKALDSKTLTKTSVRIFTAGTDNIFETSDDVVITTKIGYNSSKKMIILDSSVPADRAYRVKLYSSRIKDNEGLRIDGEFKTGGKSGNGTQGGDYQFRVRRDTGATPIARFTTNMGDIDIRLFRGASSFSTRATPLNVAAFLKVVNSSDYDDAFIHRVAKDFVVQMGGLRLTDSGQVDLVPGLAQAGSIIGEPGNANSRGTVAFALSNGPNTADNEFFFNTTTNSNLDDSSNGGPFTVFGKITNSKGLAVLDAINALHRLDLSTPLQGAGSSVNNVPVKSTVTVQGENAISGGTTTKTLNTFKDLVVVSRIAVISKVVAA